MASCKPNVATNLHSKVLQFSRPNEKADTGLICWVKISIIFSFHYPLLRAIPVHLHVSLPTHRILRYSFNCFYKGL